MGKPRRPKHYDRPGKRPGPANKGSYQDQKAPDVHQELADELGIDRERAKIINYATLYGVAGKDIFK